MSATLNISLPTTPADPAAILYVYDNLAVKGNSATGGSPTKFDLELGRTKDGLAVLEVYLDQTLVDTGETDPVAPGDAKKITLNIAVSDREIPLESAPTVLANVIATTLECALNNDATSKLLFRSEFFALPARWVYVWVDNDTLASHSVVGVTAAIIRH